MDPALHERLARVPRNAWIEAIALLAPGAELPPGTRTVTRFGDVVTCRVRARDVVGVRAARGVTSLKAARRLDPGGAVVDAAGDAVDPVALHPEGGAGVVIGVVDWGFDLAHPLLRRADGGTRVISLWDQRGTARFAPYGYGTRIDRAAIDRALDDTVYDLYATGTGARPAHGTHVASIAATLAPQAELVLVHLATPAQPETEDLGDCVRLLEALDFIRATAGDRPWVVNLSLGRTGGEHGGHSLVERAMDALLESTPGCAVIQSAGNYRERGLHHAGRLGSGGRCAIEWAIHDGDPTGNELEIWYSGRDRFLVRVSSPAGDVAAHAELARRVPVIVAGREVGRLYHRANDPTNGDHHIDLILDVAAPPGTWSIELRARDVVDGRYHAWIERDLPGLAQSQFPIAFVSTSSTVGTIANGYRTLVVGACDARRADRPIAAFSSSGPTRDGRMKPDLIAPGVAIRAARSTVPGDEPGSGGVVALTGTSMAAPHVTGTVACLFGAVAPHRLPIHHTRALVLGTCTPCPDADHAGAGYLDPAAAIAAGALHKELICRTSISSTRSVPFSTAALPSRRGVRAMS